MYWFSQKINHSFTSYSNSLNCHKFFLLLDRHLENYIVKNNQLYPVDITFLFWEGNEQWVNKYIAGGAYEINVLAQYADKPEVLKAKLELFFFAYQKIFQELKSELKVSTKLIEEFFSGKDYDTKRKIKYVQSTLQDPGYVHQQKQLYQIGFKKMLKRVKHKKLLEEIYATQGDLEDDRLKMYYLANKGRHTCFFLIGKKANQVFSKIDELMKKIILRK